MLAMTHPTYFMPVHGEAIHLRAHAKLAVQMGIPEENIFVEDNGDTLEMRGGVVRRGAPVESGIVYVDGLRIGDTEPAVLRDRQKLSQDGIVTCVIAISSRSHKVDEVEISSRGVSFANDDELINGAQESVRTSINNASSGGSSIESLRKTARNNLSNYLWNKTHTRPMLIPVVMEV